MHLFDAMEICSCGSRIRSYDFRGRRVGVTLAREQIKNLPHPSVVFRPLANTTKADYWIAWHRENHSKALLQYIEVVKKQAVL
jgi:hypothetical protein